MAEGEDVAGFFTPLEEFEFWLEEMEDKLNSSSSSSSSSSAAMKKPKTRAEACQLIAVSKKLLKECEKRQQPEELLEKRKKKKEERTRNEDDEYFEEEEEEEEEDEEEEPSPKVEELRTRYNLVRATLEDNLAKAEALCECWDKLKEDMAKLTKAISSGGSGSKLTMAKLESSINQIKRTFRQRASIIEDLSASTGGAA